MRRILNHEENDEEEDEDGEGEMKDKSSDIDNRCTSISISGKAEDRAATKCFDDLYQRKRKFLDGSSSSPTCSSSNLGQPVYIKQKFDEFRMDRGLSPEQIHERMNRSVNFRSLSDDILLYGNSYSLTTPPTIAFIAPAVTNEATIGEYGIDASDQIIVDVLPPTYVPLDPDTALPEIVYDTERIRDTTNSINRGQFTAPPADAPVTIVSNRNKIRSIMASFMFPLGSYFHPKPFEFVVERRGNLIYFGTLDEVPGEVSHPQPSLKAYDIPFEVLTTTTANPTLHGFFRFQSYSILGIPLIVRSEIDCVDDANQYYELKSKKGRPDGRHPPADNVEYMRYIWCQMFLGKFHDKASDIMTYYFKIFQVQVVLTRLFSVCTMKFSPI